jgi:hypothetical protein
MRSKWNTPNDSHSPYKYFGSSGKKDENGNRLGILHPIGVDKDKNIIYQYNG